MKKQRLTFHRFYMGRLVVPCPHHLIRSREDQVMELETPYCFCLVLDFYDAAPRYYDAPWHVRLMLLAL